MFGQIYAKIKDAKIIPVVKTDIPQNAVNLAGALLLGGINAIEITFRTTQGEEDLEKIAECIKAVRTAHPAMLIGAGTVINPRLAELAQKAGADFIVAPGFNEQTVNWCISRDVPIIPGVNSPTLVEAALAKNLTVLKFFPADISGGTKMLKSLAGPFPQVKFIPTGGINETNTAEYLSCPNVLAVGGSWMVKEDLVKTNSWDKISELAEKAVKSASAPAPKTNGPKIKNALYLIPVTLGETELDRVIPPYNRQIIVGIKHFIVENIRSARRFLVQAVKGIDIDALTFYELNEHTDLTTISGYLDPLQKQKLPMGVISEAGCPAVADPGAIVVEQAHKKNLQVIPLAGPSSMIMSVMASGFNGQSFAFNGYLPVKNQERAAKIRQLEGRAWKEKQTQLFIEAPYRNLKMLETLAQTCRPDTKICIAAGMTTEQEFIAAHTAAEWKKLPAPPINKVPAIFLIYGK